MNSGVQVSNIGGYANVIQSLRLIEEGGFTNSNDSSGNKGIISLHAEDTTIKVMEREASAKWTDTNVKQADLEGYSLVSRYVQTKNKIYLREVDEIGLTGGDVNATGLLSDAAFPATAAAGAVASLTPQAAYDEIATLINTQHDLVSNTPEYMATSVTMPTRVMSHLQRTMMDTASGVGSTLEALKTNFPDISFVSTFRAESVGGTSRTVAHSTSDESMIMRIPQALTIGEIIKVGSFDFHMDSKYRIAGLDVLEGTAGAILTGL